MYKTSPDGINFLKSLESCKLHAYPDQTGKFTIGYGSTYYEDKKTPVQEGDVITQERAETLLELFVQSLDRTMNNVILVPMRQNQWDALVAHIYNNGINEFKRSKILKLINNGRILDVPSHILLYNKSRDPHTKELKLNEGLINRTRKEVELFNKK